MGHLNAHLVPRGREPPQQQRSAVGAEVAEGRSNRYYTTYTIHTCVSVAAAVEPYGRNSTTKTTPKPAPAAPPTLSAPSAPSPPPLLQELAVPHQDV